MPLPNDFLRMGQLTEPWPLFVVGRAQFLNIFLSLLNENYQKTDLENEFDLFGLSFAGENWLALDELGHDATTRPYI